MSNTHHKDNRAGDTYFQDSVRHTFSNQFMLNCVAGTGKKTGVERVWQDEAGFSCSAKEALFGLWGEF